MISVRSEVQVFPGPPRFAVGYAWRGHVADEAKCARHSPKGDGGLNVSIRLLVRGHSSAGRARALQA